MCMSDSFSVAKVFLACKILGNLIVSHRSVPCFELFVSSFVRAFFCWNCFELWELFQAEVSNWTLWGWIISEEFLVRKRWYYKDLHKQDCVWSQIQFPSLLRRSGPTKLGTCSIVLAIVSTIGYKASLLHRRCLLSQDGHRVWRNWLLHRSSSLR